MSKGLPDFRKLFESSPGLYLVLDPDLHIVAVTDSYLAATMSKRESIVGRPLFEIFPDNPNDPAASGVSNLRDSLQAVLQDRVPNAMAVQKYDIRKPDSEGGGFEERFWSPLNSPVLGADGEVAYIIHRVEDVTEFVRLKRQGAEQHRLTEELRSRAERMESEIFIRAQEVQEVNKQLRFAHEQVTSLYERTKELDQLRTQFFANVSHELRTPLTLILAPARKLLKEEGITDEERRGLETIERNARLLLKHVNDLLDLSRLEAGKMELQYAEDDLAKLSRLVGSHFETSAEDRGIEYTIETPDSLVAQYDPAKIQRILLNLISNAMKFTPEGGVVRLKLQAGEGKALIHVADSGPGIPQSMQTAVFERFRQVDGNVTRAFGGTGLGLAIVKEFVDLHDGVVHAGSSAEGGALFTVELPLQAPGGVEVSRELVDTDQESAEQAAEELRLQSRVSVDEGRTPEPGLPLVLVVEDNFDMRTFLADMLQERYRVVTAVDGADGLTKALQHQPDLIISDMMMPRMSGDQMVKAIRSHIELEDVPIVLLTAKADEVLRVNLLKEEVQEYLHKPFSIEELFARVGRHITERQKSEKTKAQLAAIVASSYDAVIGMTLEGIVTSWNPGAERLFGYDADRRVGEPISSLVAPSRQPELAAGLESVRRGDQLENLDLFDLGDNGRHIDTSATISPLKNTLGEVVGASMIVRDVTAQKRAENEIRLLNADLERRVAERTREYEIANQELEAFSYSVSHDLRTPLRSIYGFSEVLAEEQADKLDEEGKDYLNRVRQAAKRMSQLIDDLLMLSKISRSELRRQPVDLSALAQSVADDIYRQDDSRAASFGIQPGLTADADERLLCIVLENLMGNAWKFTSKKEHARIEVGKTLEDGKPVFFVKDNGAGFDGSQAKQLFVAFQRLHSATDFPGTGIGLATVHRIIQRHGGRIWAESELGNGSRFYFTLSE